MTAGETAHFSLFGRAPPLRHYVIDEVAMYYADSAGKPANASDLNDQAIYDAHSVAGSVIGMSEEAIELAVEKGALINDTQLARGKAGHLGAFYAPFDWINSKADVVIVGISPGKEQAKTALKTFRRQLLNEALNETTLRRALSEAKAAASFDGQMRDIAAKLMDHFRIHDLLGLSNSSQLFGAASGRAHYTSAYRYPVLANKNGVWANYSGGEDVRSQSNPLLSGFVNDYLIPELQCFPDSWIIPFGPTPAAILSELGRSGIVDESKILAGLNHPTGQQWNRHRCQLDMVDHDRCATNVGCSKIQQRSLALRSRVLALLA